MQEVVSQVRAGGAAAVGDVSFCLGVIVTKAPYGFHFSGIRVPAFAVSERQSCCESCLLTRFEI